LKKAPGERYATVDAFAEDLRRYLHHEPVSARADSLAYRAAKFVRRHRVAVGAAALVALALIAGVTGTIWQALEAARQRDRALLQLQRAETASGFVAKCSTTPGAQRNASRLTNSSPAARNSRSVRLKTSRSSRR